MIQEHMKTDTEDDFPFERKICEGLGRVSATWLLGYLATWQDGIWV